MWNARILAFPPLRTYYMTLEINRFTAQGMTRSTVEPVPTARFDCGEDACQRVFRVQIDPARSLRSSLRASGFEPCQARSESEDRVERDRRWRTVEARAERARLIPVRIRSRAVVAPRVRRGSAQVDDSRRGRSSGRQTTFSRPTSTRAMSPSSSRSESTRETVASDQSV